MDGINKPITLSGINGPINVAPNAITDPYLMDLINKQRQPASIGQSFVQPPQVQMADFQAPQAPVAPEVQQPAQPEISIPQTQPMGDINKGINQRIQSANMLAESQKQQAEAVGAAYGAADVKLQEYEKNRQDLEKRRQSVMDEKSKDMDAASASLNKFEYKDYWADRSAGSKIMAAVATAMGAYGSALTGTQNYAMTILNSAVEDDLQKQKLAYEKLKGRAADAKDAYSMAARMFDDEGDRMNAARAMINDRLTYEVGKLGAMAKSPEAKAKALDLQGQLNVLRGEYGQKALESSADKLIQLEKIRGEQKKVQLEEQKDTRSRVISGLDVRDPRTGQMMPQIAKTPEDAKKASDFVENYESMKQGLKNLKEMRKKYGVGEFFKQGAAGLIGQDTELETNIRNAVTDLQLSYKEVKKLGTLDKGSEKYLERILDPDTLTQPGFGMDQIDAALNTLEKEKHAFLKARGLISPEKDLEKRE